MHSVRRILTVGLLTFAVPVVTFLLLDRLLTQLPSAQAASPAVDVSCILENLTIEDPYCGTYTVIDLGPVPGLPTLYGGLTFKAGDNDTILIGGAANTTSGELYAVKVKRDASNHIIGFSSTATPTIAAAYNDGGVVYGPNSTLFLAQWPVNTLLQARLGVTPTRTINLATLTGNVNSSPGGVGFVPVGYAGAGSLKLAGYGLGDWWSGAVSLDSTGFYTITGLQRRATLDVGPEGFIYVPPGSPKFTDFTTMLVSEFDNNAVAAYTIDSRGDPISTTRQPFLTGLDGAEGAAIDPVTGDFLFSTYSGNARVIVVKGFGTPPAKTTQEVQPATGANIAVAGQSTGQLNIPPGGVSSSTIITVEIVKTPNSAQAVSAANVSRRTADITEVGAELSISGSRTADGTPVTTFDKPVTITMSLADSSQVGLNITSATIKRFDPAQGQFVNTGQSTTFNSSANSFSTTDTHLSRYAVFGEITRIVYIGANYVGFKLPG